ncbi:uracil-DNA glycosylase [Alkalilimnicola ehrlichii MLHE-1]|uniref:Type-4 uracil-DNA glycosylase n=1 Tax=Alkalilimnicola ehrlichii (strain ATCC BAA-1101 / DSM 17681 / MLHE-1) TaxID=187272 RepID=Q0AB81_ALKEH|nr:uracil-DNA glycosylase [Alkalilimnicola ehrlichii]ABI55906.1 phage SPO1 DNA polymerase-related protein [Alkalilimnicola ehrlichii MLHE-1]
MGDAGRDARRYQRLRQMGVDLYVPRPGAGPQVADAVPAGPDPVRDGAPEPGPAPADVVTAPPAAEPAAASEADPTSGDVARLNWAALEDRVAGCRLCGLCEGRRNTVFGVGSRQADLVLVGEGPGAEEDKRGEPFVGQAGRLLDRMLAAIGLDRSRVYICNVVKCRPPRNRDPRPEEVAACRPYLERQLTLLEPRLIVALGRVSAHQLLNVTTPLGRLRGGLHRYAPVDVPLLATYHPAYLLRNPADKARAWEDLKRIRRILAE